MPIVRKVSAATAAAWQTDPASLDVAALPRPPRDMTGLTRVNYPNRKRNSPGWMARVYHGGEVIIRFFSDRRYGSERRALLQAAAWRNAVREQIGPPPPRPRRRGILRVDRPDWGNVGYFAWRPAGRRRYFSDARFGGPDGARQAAEEWTTEAVQGP
jgi:hypothetical protein